MLQNSIILNSEKYPKKIIQYKMEKVLNCKTPHHFFQLIIQIGGTLHKFNLIAKISLIKRNLNYI